MHTPGPWKFDGRRIVAQNGEVVLSPVGGKTYDECTSDPAEIECSDDDMKLITAAPALRAALRELSDAVNDGLGNSGTPGFDDTRLDRALEEAAKVISKAERNES